MLDILDKYDEMLEKVPDLIANSKFKKEYIISELNLTRSTFYNKLKNSSFSSGELRKLAELMFPEETKLYKLQKSIEKGLDDIDAGKLKSHETVMRSFRKQYGG